MFCCYEVVRRVWWRWVWFWQLFQKVQMRRRRRGCICSPLWQLVLLDARLRIFVRAGWWKFRTSLHFHTVLTLVVIFFYQKVRRLDSTPLKSISFPYKVWFIFPKKCADSTLFCIKCEPTRFCLAQKVRRLDLNLQPKVRRLNFCPTKSAPTCFVFLICTDMNLFLKSAPTALCDD